MFFSVCVCVGRNILSTNDVALIWNTHSQSEFVNPVMIIDFVCLKKKNVFLWVRDIRKDNEKKFIESINKTEKKFQIIDTSLPLNINYIALRLRD